jgi:hypothetical protein
MLRERYNALRARKRKDRLRLHRQFKLLVRIVPALKNPISFILNEKARLVRIPIAILLVLGGVFSILPFLGIWMLPLGLLLLAVDIVFLRAPVSALVIKARVLNRARKMRRTGTSEA